MQAYFDVLNTTDPVKIWRHSPLNDDSIHVLQYGEQIELCDANGIIINYDPDELTTTVWSHWHRRDFPDYPEDLFSYRQLWTFHRFVIERSIPESGVSFNLLKEHELIGFDRVRTVIRFDTTNAVLHAYVAEPARLLSTPIERIRMYERLPKGTMRNILKYWANTHIHLVPELEEYRRAAAAAVNDDDDQFKTLFGKNKAKVVGKYIKRRYHHVNAFSNVYVNEKSGIYTFITKEELDDCKPSPEQWLASNNLRIVTYDDWVFETSDGHYDTFEALYEMFDPLKILVINGRLSPFAAKAYDYWMRRK